MFYWIVMVKPFITKTRLYNSDPLQPHFYIVKLGFTGVYIIFLISAQNIAEAVLTSTHNLCFEPKYGKYQNFYRKIFSFWWWNFQYIWIGVFAWCTAVYFARPYTLPNIRNSCVFYLEKNNGYDISSILSPKEVICKKCHVISSAKYQKKIQVICCLLILSSVH